MIPGRTPCVVGLLAGLVAAGLADVAGAAERWRCATTSHFTIYSAAEPDSVLQTARELERMAEILRMWDLVGPA